MSVLTLDVIARDRASKVLAGIGKKTDESGGKFNKWAGVAAGAGVVVGATLVKFGKASVKAYTEAQSKQAQLQNAFKKFPALADTNIGALQKLNTELSKKTKYDDDATASGQATLAQFKLTGSQITQLTPLLQDYASKTGKDLPTAAKDLGKAMLGQGKALKGVGINFKDTGTASGNFKELMGGLNGAVGGFATNEGKTAAGQAEILKNQFGEVEETVGSKLVPVLMSLAGILLGVIGFMQKYAGVVVPVVAVLGTLAGIVYTIITVTKIWTAVQAALNIVMSLNPIGVVIITLGLLIAGLVLAYKKSETFRNIVNGAFNAVKATVGAVVGFIRDHWKLLFGILTGPVGLAVVWITTHWGTVKGIFSGIKKAIAGAFKGLAGAIEAPFRTAFGWIRSAIQGVVNAFTAAKNFITGGSAAGVAAAVQRNRNYTTGRGGGVTGVGHNAGGTSNWRGGLTWVGEGGAELLDVPRGSKIHTARQSAAMAGGGGNVYITVNGALDPVAVGNQIVTLLQKKQQRTGPLQIRTVG